jgi:dihydrodipicolinate synthase/N-acetylneuraminate lyase
MASTEALARFHRGAVIPAHPLALNAQRKWDERRQRALTRYYLAAGAGGLAVGVHTTQFAIRNPKVGLFEPLLALTREEMRELPSTIAIAGVSGDTQAAVREAELAARLNYDAALVRMPALASMDELVEHVRIVSEVIPVIGFYLQPAVGGCLLPYAFWRRFAEVPNVIGVKISPFNRYQTIDVIRAVADAERDDITLYTGNDDNIVIDLLTPHRFHNRTLRIRGGLLGHWAVWTQRAVEMHARLCETTHATAADLQLAIEVTDANAAFFDVAHQFHGCIAGIHEVLRRQGLLEGFWCLDENEGLSPGQAEEITRVHDAYPHLHDDAFVNENLDRWLQ